MINRYNISTIYAGKDKRFLIFQEKGELEIVDEQMADKNPFFDITQEDVDETHAETILTQFNNKDLIMYDNSNYSFKILLKQMVTLLFPFNVSLKLFNIIAIIK